MHRDAMSSERNAPRSSGARKDTKMHEEKTTVLQHYYNMAGEGQSTPCQNLRVPVALFERVTDKTPQESVVEWTRLVGMLTHHDVRTGKDGRLWSPVAYGPTKARAARNVAEVSCLVLDFDDGARTEELTPAWEEKGLEFVIHTTHSHMENGKTPKWRAIFPLARAVPASEWEATYKKLFAHLAGGHADPACKDVSRIYYLPSCPPEHAALAFAEHHPGRPLNPDEVPEPAEKAERQRAVLPAKIPKGKRNPTLFPWACALRREGLSEEEILARLIKENEERCEEPLPLDDVRGIAHRAAQYPAGEAGRGEGRGGGRPSVATVLVELAQEAELFATPDAEPTPYADVPADGHREVLQVRSSGFRRWLTARFFAATGGVPGTQAFEEALRTIEALAVAGDDRRPVHVRVAGHGGRVYLDLCDPSWRVVEIDPTGWRVLQRSPVAFRRTRGMLPLPEPERGGSIEDLRALANVRDDDGFRLVVAWLVMALHPGGPYPVLALHGEQGSAKSYTARVLRSIIDPNRAPLRAEPRSVQDLQIAANNSWVVALDNVSHLPAWLSDALCRVATGGGFATRALYTDGEEAIFDARRPTLMTGIEEVATRGDLQDRALVVELGRIDDADRLPERELDARVEALRPRVLGGLLDAAAAALRRQDEVTPPPLARMADFVVWVHAAEPALPWSEGDFVATYARNRGAAVQTVLEADVISAHLRALAADGWSGTASELLAELERRADDATKRARGWPGSARALSGRLRRLAPALRRVGVCIEFTRRPRTGQRLVSLETVRTEPSPASPPSPECQKRSNSAIFGGDANGSSGDAKCGLRHPVASPEESSNGAGSPGVGDAGDAGDAKFATLSEGESEAGERAVNPEKKDTQNGVIGVTGVTAASPQTTESPDAVHQAPVDDEIGNCTCCGRPADRFTATGQPICSECVEGASARTADGPGDAPPQNTEPADHQCPVGDAGDAKFATLSEGESEVVL